MWADKNEQKTKDWKKEDGNIESGWIEWLKKTTKI